MCYVVSMCFTSLVYLLMWLHRCCLSVSAGMPRYPAPYPMVRPGFVPRPMPPPGVVTIQRPPIISGIRAIPPLVALTARPPPPAVMLADKPPTAVYVGKIAPTVDNGFLLSLLQVCLLFSYMFFRCMYGRLNNSLYPYHFYL
jgi:hypothetical protein